MKSRLFAAASISALLVGVAACATAPVVDVAPDARRIRAGRPYQGKIRAHLTES